jgi:hypothetical protein
MSAGYVTLGQIQERPQAVEVSCNHCDRRGQLRIGCLTTEHGQRLPVRELRPFVADCPRMMSARRIWARQPEDRRNRLHVCPHSVPLSGSNAQKEPAGAIREGQVVR